MFFSLEFRSVSVWKFLKVVVPLNMTSYDQCSMILGSPTLKKREKYLPPLQKKRHHIGVVHKLDGCPRSLINKHLKADQFPVGGTRNPY